MHTLCFAVANLSVLCKALNNPALIFNYGNVLGSYAHVKFTEFDKL